MSEWTYVHAEAHEALCQIHYFGFTKVQPEGNVEFVITLKEHVNPKDPAMKFFAQADKQTNQKALPFTPVGWGTTLHVALSECVKAIRRFPYEPA
jgi:hypothetical protein